MQDIKLKTLTFRNFMSYGDTDNTVVFMDGLTYLNAANGYGKSTIIEALTFVLFGKPYRKGTIPELKNTENVNSDMVVVLEFSVTNSVSTHDYVIERRIKAKGGTPVVKIFVDGVEQNKKAGYTQDTIEETILGFSLVLYKYVIAMNSQETTSFIEMDAAKKRELIEKVISVSTDKWKKPNNKLLADASVRFDVASKSIARITKDIEYTEAMIESLKNDRQVEIDELQSKLDNEHTKVSPLTESVNASKTIKDSAELKLNEVKKAQVELGNVRREIDAYNRCIQYIERINVEESNIASKSKLLNDNTKVAESYNIDTKNAELANANATLLQLRDKMYQGNAFISSSQREIANLQQQKLEIQHEAESHKVGVPCPTCGKLSTEEDVDKVKSTLRIKWKELNSKVAEINNAITSMQETISTNEQTIASLNETISTLTNGINEYNKYVDNNIKPLKYSIQEAEDNIASMKRELSRYSNNPDELMAKLNELNSTKDSLEAIVANFNEVAESYNLASNDYSNKYYSLSQLNENIRRMENELFRMKSGQNQGALQQSIDHLVELNAELVNTQKESTEQSDIITSCKYITHLCSDDGLKSYLIKTFIPFFNNAVEENLQRFNLPFHFVFDSTLKYTFSSGIGTAPDYEMLSQGQKRKVGFAIAMAFCDFVSTIANFRINCLFLDEILDISTDDAALRDMVSLVRTRTEKTPVIFAVTHRAKIIQDLFDYKLNIMYNGLFSSIGDVDDISKNVNTAGE